MARMLVLDQNVLQRPELPTLIQAEPGVALLNVRFQRRTGRPLAQGCPAALERRRHSPQGYERQQTVADSIGREVCHLWSHLTCPQLPYQRQVPGDRAIRCGRRWCEPDAGISYGTASVEERLSTSMCHEVRPTDPKS